MTTELEVIPQGNLNMAELPNSVLEQAKSAAKSLQTVIQNKRKPVMFNGEQYLEFEDWQTCGRFYGLAAKVVSTQFAEYGDSKGFEARAEVIRTSDGMVISSAESMCLNDEPNWSKKPLFQLKSMAQTRACAKALRNVLAWVVVLAGYKPTPAEEMDGVRKERNAETVITDDLPEPRKKSGTEITDDQLPNYIMPGGKYQGMTLSKILGETTEAGKAKGLEYLKWCTTEEAKVSPKLKDTISRFLNLMEV